jgi:hypothetical protein
MSCNRNIEELWVRKEKKVCESFMVHVRKCFKLFEEYVRNKIFHSSATTLDN